ncbi:MAG: BglII/BstYI family type II restriction endonuclease [Opitutaceae bacterium]
MDTKIESYRFAKEILEHRKFRHAWKEITSAIENCPLYLWPNKSKKNTSLDVVQQLLNTYFDRRFGVDLQWEHHPLATGIVDSELRADFRKSFGDLTIQVEVQFGNMARWYTDVFKFQTACSQREINLAVCILPVWELARRIDSNIAHFERAWRELPSAELSITLPILMVGVRPGRKTTKFDVSRAGFTAVQQVTKGDNKWRLVHGLLTGVEVQNITADSPTGPMIEPTAEDET